jgi:hypothetical protein
MRWLNRILRQDQWQKKGRSGHTEGRQDGHPGWVLQPEQVLVGTYRIEKMIGRPGGMGQVFAAQDRTLSLQVAIKVPALHILAAP